MNGYALFALVFAYVVCGVWVLWLDRKSDDDEEDSRFMALGAILIVLCWPLRLIALCCWAYDEYWQDDEARAMRANMAIDCGCKKCKAVADEGA